MDVTFFDAKTYDRTWFEPALSGRGLSGRFFDHKLSFETAVLAGGSWAVCVFVNDVVNAKVIEALYELGVRLIALRCAGYNNVDFQAAYGKIHVVRVPSYSPAAVAEHAMALLLTLNRKTHKAYNRTRDNNFSISGLMGKDLSGKTVGVVGAGKIGRVFMEICKGFNMRVLAYDVTAKDIPGVQFVSLDELFSLSDVISLHCPLLKETHHLVNSERIRMMREGAMLINTSRGALVDTEALLEGLKSKKIGAAGLDVYEEEGDYFFEDLSDEIIEDDELARLLTFPNVLVTSHQAFFTGEAMSEIANVTVESLSDFENGRELKNEICYRCKSGECRKTAGKRCF